ncbi:MAG: hypothetical protein M1510_11605 [Nitrospirae bacterium]|nr:hypothetical protein [Nitrospirota bacterium]
MSKAKRKIDSTQMSIFAHLKPDVPPEPGSMNISVRARQIISSAIRKSGKDRIDICADIYKLTGIEVPKSTLDGWSAESRDISGDSLDYNGNKRWGMSIDVVNAFCESTGNYDLLFLLAETSHYKALKGKDVVRARVGLLKEEKARIDREMKELERALVEKQ